MTALGVAVLAVVLVTLPFVLFPRRRQLTESEWLREEYAHDRISMLELERALDRALELGDPPHRETSAAEQRPYDEAKRQFRPHVVLGTVGAILIAFFTVTAALADNARRASQSRPFDPESLPTVADWTARANAQCLRGRLLLKNVQDATPSRPVLEERLRAYEVVRDGIGRFGVRPSAVATISAPVFAFNDALDWHADALYLLKRRDATGARVSLANGRRIGRRAERELAAIGAVECKGLF